MVGYCLEVPNTDENWELTSKETISHNNKDTF